MTTTYLVLLDSLRRILGVCVEKHKFPQDVVLIKACFLPVWVTR